MLEMDTMPWEEPARMKLERNLNFATLPADDDDYGFSRKKASRDPMSHRIIEKRRRDRMNNCLADLSRLVPTNYLKKGRGRIEKTEIIEMAIKHLKHLQAHPCKDPANCEVAKAADQEQRRQFRFGYTECMNEALRFVAECASDALAARLAAHLHRNFEQRGGPEPKPAAAPPSQLREMLQNPDLPGAQPRTPDHQHVYKFKKDIKHRFEHQRCGPPSPPPLLCVEEPLSVKVSWDEGASSCSGSNSSPPPARSNGSSSGYSTSGEPPPKGRSPTLSPAEQPGVPVFALHPGGAFYIPLTLEASLLVPHMAGADEVAPVLHPVSICVNLGAHALKVPPLHGHCRPPSSFFLDRVPYREGCS